MTAGERIDEAEWRRLVEEASGEGLLCFDREGCCRYANAASLRLLGYDDAGQILGQGAQILTRPGVKNPSAADVPAVLAAVYEHARSSIAERAIFRRADGSALPVTCRVLPVLADNAFVGAAVIFTAGSSKAFGRSGAMESAARLARGIVHDLNNILGIAVGNLELAQMSLPQEETKEATARNALLAKVDRALRRGAALTDRLLFFAADRPQGLVATDISAAIRAQSESLAEALGPQIDLELRLAQSGPQVRVNPKEFDAVLMDLILNARDALEGAGRVTIESSAETLGEAEGRPAPPAAPGDYLVVAVADNGPGMSGNVAFRAFEPYFTTKERGKGKGMGLSGVYGFAVRHGGFALLETAPGDGTTVRLFLPCIAEGAP